MAWRDYVIANPPQTETVGRKSVPDSPQAFRIDGLQSREQRWNERLDRFDAIGLRDEHEYRKR